MRPAWCYNHVSVYGAPEYVAELVSHVQGEMDFEFDHTLNGETAKGQLFSFKSIIPYEGKWDSGVGLAKWGVRCEALDVRLHYCHGSHALYEFDTPWGPPFPVCDALKTRFIDLYVSWFFHEPQGELSGYIKPKSELKEVL